jgi:D-3-phosphoglycerate dehydrogenase
MKVIIQKDLFLRSFDVFSEAAKKYGIQFFQTDELDEVTMLKRHAEGASCFVIGAESYSNEFYNSLYEGSGVIRYGVGYNAVPIDICKSRKIKVGYTPGTLTDSVAEHTFALLLGIARKIPTLHHSMTTHVWQGITGIELKNKTIAIIGFGQIGQAVARIAKYGFGMKVNAFDKREIKGNSFLNYSSNFREVVQDADIVSLHLSALPATLGFINEERITQMKNGTIFLNTARGELVVERDLYNALESGKISLAGLDVFWKEPYNPDSVVDFRKLNNVVLTPHCGSNTREANNKMADLVIKNILAFYMNKKMILIPELK